MSRLAAHSVIQQSLGATGVWSDSTRDAGIYESMLICMGFRIVQMPVLLCVGVAAILCSSCMALDNETKRAEHKKSSIERIETFTKYMMKTANEVSTDLSPILAAMGNELLGEAKADLANVAEEVRAQMTHLLPGRESRPPKARSGKE